MNRLLHISQFFYRRANIKLVGLSFALYVVFTFILYIIELGIKHYSKGPGVLDLTFGYYTRDFVFDTLTAFGSEGRGLYFIGQLFDFVFPYTVAFFFVFLYSMLLRLLVHRIHSPWRLLNLLPFLFVFFDHFENCCILLCLLFYPQMSLPYDVVGFVTVSKWMSLAVIAGLFLVLLCLYLLQMRNRSRDAKE